MASKQSTSAKFLATLVYYDEPQAVLLTRGDDRRVIAVAIEKEGFNLPFLGAEIDVKQWDRYQEESVDLRFLFTFPKWKKWYLFDLIDMDNNKIRLFPADSNQYKNESYLPDHGFFSRDHTETGLEEELVKSGTQEFSIDGTWDVPDFSKFYGKLTNIYSFFLALQRFAAGDILLPAKRRIMEAFIGKELRGGFGYVNLYKDLSSSQGRADRLIVKKIAYASPGEVQIRGRQDIFEEISGALAILKENFQEIDDYYKEFYRYLQERKLLKADPDGEFFDKNGPISKDILSRSETLAEKLKLEYLPIIYELCGRNSLRTAKALFGHYRRMRDYYMFFAEGRAAEADD